MKLMIPNGVGPADAAIFTWRSSAFELTAGGKSQSQRKGYTN
jgi:hypothetical protein